MHRVTLAMTVAAALAFTITAASDAYAKGPGGGWHGSSPPGFSQGHKTGWNGASVPPGWSKGRKKGWKGYTVPPGLYGR